VEDDGVGFDPATVPAGRFGLVGMSERARLLGGALTVESTPGGGTAIDVTVPLRDGASAPERERP
jgi:signal transduction histidine kinase